MMDSKFKHLNDVVPRGELIGIPTERKMIDKTNEQGDVLGSVPSAFDALCPLDKDDNKVVSRCIGLTLNPEDAAGFAATAALLADTAKTKTSGLSDIGSDDADSMQIVSGVFNPKFSENE